MIANWSAEASSSGTLTINSVAMSSPAWIVLDVEKLWQPPARRGANLLVPGRAGRIAMPRRVDETTYTLQMLIATDRDRHGAVVSPQAGLAANIAYLDAQIFSHQSALAATLTVPGQGSRSAWVQPELQLGDIWDGEQRAALVLTVPAGRFA